MKERSRSKSRRAKYAASRREAEQSQEENGSLVDLMFKNKALANANYPTNKIAM